MIQTLVFSYLRLISLVALQHMTLMVVLTEKTKLGLSGGGEEKTGGKRLTEGQSRVTRVSTMARKNVLSDF